jgi:small subunit ribosomal protein S1
MATAIGCWFRQREYWRRRMANLADSRKVPGAPHPGSAGRTPGPPSIKPLHDPAQDDEYLSSEDLESVNEFQLLLEMEERIQNLPQGEVLQGAVTRLIDAGLIVDIGDKLEGIVPIAQVKQPDGSVAFQPGDTIEVMVERNEQQDGYVLLSHERVSKLRVWDTLETAYREQLPVNGRVLTRVKGGLEVDVGIKAFMPSSQVDMRPLHNLDSLVGQDIPVRVVKINRRRGNVVVSRRVMQEDEFNARKDAVLGHVDEGSVVTGTVKNLTDYGAFIDLGGIDGLLHVSDMSHGRVNHPQEIVHPGDTITCRVLKLDKAKGRVSLGLKQLVPDPWETVHERYQTGGKVIGRVVSITDYGSFVELEPGVEGLIHISEMTWSRRMKHPSKVLKAGDTVECVIIEVKPEHRRISLGIKQLEADPWTTIAGRYAIGSVVEGRVRKLTDFGAFLEIEEGIDGLIHISDFSWTKRLKHPSEIAKRGQVVQAVVLNIDVNNRRLSLGIKQLQPDAWETFFQTHFVNDVIRGKVVRAATFGVFVELAPGVEGLCHNIEIPGAPERRGDKRQQLPADESPLPLGAEFDFKVIKMNETDKKIGLSLKELLTDDERKRIEDYQRRAAERSAKAESAIRGAVEPAAEAPADDAPHSDS